jgi:hypothetical protein
LNPILTLRRYTTRGDLSDALVDITDVLCKYGFKYTDLVKEYSMYDSNVELDKGWLFGEKPDDFITKVNKEMYFS